MYDVIIVGAGPAGSACARACAQQGLKTLLLDKDLLPRSKPCGGAVSGYALSLLDFPLPEDLIENECFGARVHYDGRIIEAQRQYRIAVIVSRDRFDAFLANKAVECNAQFLPGERVVGVHEARDGVTVDSEKTSYQTRFLVGADGVHSGVARAIRQPLGKSGTVLALVSHILLDSETMDKRRDRTIDMHFGIAPQGYGWLFPHRGYLSLGIMGLASAIEEPKKVLSGFARALGMELAAVQGHSIPLGGLRRNVASGRILLVGDAAGFADPFQGEGISHAIRSGKLAAQAIIESIKENRGPASAAARYSRESDQFIRKNLAVALRMARLLDRHPHLFLRIFFDHPEALEHYLDIVGGRTDYRHFQQWLLLRLPWYLLAGCISKAGK